MSCTRRINRVRAGFTLIEAALATVIVGVGVVSVLQLIAACTQQNSVGVQSTTAMLLATHIQEAMAGLSFNDPGYGNAYFGPEPGETLSSYNDVDDFNGATFSPPIDATRTSIAAQSQYSQVVHVMPVYAGRLSSNTNPSAPELPNSTVTGVVRVVVRVLYQRAPGQPAVEVHRTSWLRTAG